MDTRLERAPPSLSLKAAFQKVPGERRSPSVCDPHLVMRPDSGSFAGGRLVLGGKDAETSPSADPTRRPPPSSPLCVCRYHLPHPLPDQQAMLSSTGGTSRRERGEPAYQSIRIILKERKENEVYRGMQRSERGKERRG